VELAEIRFRPMVRADLPMLSVWLSEPHVAVWWREPSDLSSVEARYVPSVDGTGSTEVFIVNHRGTPIGLVQRYLLSDEPSWLRSLAPSGDHSGGAGIDYLIGVPTAIGGGLGPLMIDAFVADTWARYPGITEVVASVAQPNRRSWRALEKVGFVRTWSGDIFSDDPSDNGPSHVYVLARPASS
jgi:aminoglycoside 6'-N-acetyltransferase